MQRYSTQTIKGLLSKAGLPIVEIPYEGTYKGPLLDGADKLVRTLDDDRRDDLVIGCITEIGRLEEATLSRVASDVESAGHSPNTTTPGALEELKEILARVGVDLSDPRLTLLNRMAAHRRTCFVIMPFSETAPSRTSEYWTSFFNDFLKPAIDSKGFDAHRSESKPGKISKNIVQDLAYSDLVVAVLTDNNPNVWYELGIRHASRLNTIMVIEEGQTPAFDVRDYWVISYGRNNRRKFEKDLEPHIGREPQTDNPVAEFLQIRPNIAVNMAVGLLREATRLTEEGFESGGWNQVQEVLSRYQTSLPKKYAQVSIVGSNGWHFHADGVGPQLEESYMNVVEPGVSFLPTMRKERSGLRVGSIKDYEDRLTVLAFDTLEHPACLVVAEAHYWQKGKRPY